MKTVLASISTAFWNRSRSRLSWAVLDWRSATKPRHIANRRAITAAKIKPTFRMVVELDSWPFGTKFSQSQYWTAAQAPAPNKTMAMGILNRQPVLRTNSEAEETARRPLATQLGILCIQLLPLIRNHTSQRCVGLKSWGWHVCCFCPFAGRC